MATMKIETFIARSPDEVFAYVRDYANQKTWQGKNVTELIVEPPGPANVGTRVHKARRTPGGEVRFTMEVTEMDESARQWTENTITGSLQGTKAIWRVLPERNGSKVIHIAEFHATGFSKLLLPLITSAARKDFNSEFANLKKILEADQ